MQAIIKATQNSNQDFSNLQMEGLQNMQSPLRLQSQRQEDLQLLIRAHEKIRNLEEEIAYLIQQKESVDFQLQQEKQKSKNLSQENKKLRTQIDQLQVRIKKFENEFNCQYQMVTEQSQEKIQHQKISNFSRKQSTDIEANSYDIIPTKEPSKRIEKQSEKTLKPSDSTPVILNINVNTISKQQRHQFLSSCKVEFAQQLQKINQKESSIQRTLNRNRSEYFEPNYQSRTNSKNKYETNNFLRQAQKEFENSTSSTLKNNCYIDRKKSTSSGSLIKRNLSKNYQKNLPKDMLGDRTNYVNSKYASVNQIMSNNSAKNSYLTKSTNNHLRLGSTHDYSALKNINGEFSKNIYCSNDKRTDLKERKQKQFDMQLRNNNNNGFIKYRGLCL